MTIESAPGLFISLENFKKTNRKQIRILHLGNVANNAYLNAKFQRNLGVEADVLCYDYYHALSTPEWEEVDFWGFDNDAHPRFTKKILDKYKRPDWFIQGPFLLCYLYIKASRNNRKIKLFFLHYLIKLALDNEQVARLYYPRVYHMFFLLSKLLYIFNRPAYYLKKLIRRICKRSVNIKLDYEYNCFIQSKIGEFNKLFPNRKDKLCESDIQPYIKHLKYWSEIFEHYDIIEAYGVSPILPMLVGNKPYVAFEHGTLRAFTMEDNPLHRLTAMAYRKADWSFITNGDCLKYANNLGLKNFSPMIHPVDIQQHRYRYVKEVKLIREKFNTDILLFCPLRHDWSVKGTHLHIKALPLLRERYLDGVTVFFTLWGADVEKSKLLIQKLNCESLVVWLQPLPRIKMIQYMQAANVVLDQMALPHFGSTAIQSLASGTPVIMSYKPESTDWIVKQPAPIIAAFSPKQIVDGVCLALKTEWRKLFDVESKDWINKYHSINRTLNSHFEVYNNILGEKI